MRCPDCNKFVGLEFEEDPEGDVQVDANGHVTGNVRIVRSCAECGQELKEANLEIDCEPPSDLEKHKETCKAEGDLEVEAEYDKIEEGGSRYKKSYYGASADITITCPCGATFKAQWDDKVQASGMEELG